MDEQKRANGQVIATLSGNLMSLLIGRNLGNIVVLPQSSADKSLQLQTCTQKKLPTFIERFFI